MDRRSNAGTDPDSEKTSGANTCAALSPGGPGHEAGSTTPRQTPTAEVPRRPVSFPRPVPRPAPRPAWRSAAPLRTSAAAAAPVSAPRESSDEREGQIDPRRVARTVGDVCRWLQIANSQAAEVSSSLISMLGLGHETRRAFSAETTRIRFGETLLCAHQTELRLRDVRTRLQELTVLCEQLHARAARLGRSHAGREQAALIVRELGAVLWTANDAMATGRELSNSRHLVIGHLRTFKPAPTLNGAVLLMRFLSKLAAVECEFDLLVGLIEHIGRAVAAARSSID